MGLGKSPASDPPEFGAAADGDADRNMILGKRYRWWLFPFSRPNVAKIGKNVEKNKGMKRSKGTIYTVC